MRRYYSRLPTLRGLDTCNLGLDQNLELRALQNIFLYSFDWQNLADNSSGYLLAICLNAKLVCPKILKVKWVSLVPAIHLRIRHHSQNNNMQFSLIYIIKLNLRGTRMDRYSFLITLLKEIV